MLICYNMLNVKMKINFRLVLSLLGYIISAIGIFMLIPAIIDYITTDKGGGVFFILFLLITFIGIILGIANHQVNNRFLTLKEGFLLTILSWSIIVICAALPFCIGGPKLSFTDAYFELMSAITTTGATTIDDLDQLSYGYHFWRAFIQWIGGIGILVTAVFLIPSLQGGGMQLYKVEAFETFYNAQDKAKKISQGILLIYLVNTILVFFALIFIANFNTFDALIHSLTSVSTAGFSNKDESIAFFNNPLAETILIYAMLSGSMPYVLLYNAIYMKKYNIFYDQQVKGMFIICGLIIILLTFWITFFNGFAIDNALRHISFSVISLITGTGYVSYDYTIFGNFVNMILFAIMIIGGCAGSTACGIKVYRFQIATKILSSYIHNLFLTKHITYPTYNNKIITNDVGNAVLLYFFLFLIILLIGATLLSIQPEIDFKTALSATLSCLTNVGPGIGKIVGPVGSYHDISNIGKWVLTIIMLAGRLEIFVLLVLFSPKFWTDQ